MRLQSFSISNGCFRPLLVLFISSWAVVGCFGQAPTGEAKSPKADAAKPPATEAANAKPGWVGKVGGGFQLENGQRSARGIMISGDLAKPYTPKDMLSFDGSVNHSTYLSGDVRETAVNNLSASAQYSHRLNNRFFLVERFDTTRNTVLGIKHRQLNAVGVGINILLLKKGEFYVVPAYAIGYHDTSVTEIDGFNQGLASYQKFRYQMASGWSLLQSWMIRTNAEHRSDLSMKGSIALSSPLIHKRLFLSLGVDYFYEGVLSAQAISSEGATRNDMIYSVKFNYQIGK